MTRNRRKLIGVNLYTNNHDGLGMVLASKVPIKRGSVTAAVSKETKRLTVPGGRPPMEVRLYA